MKDQNDEETEFPILKQDVGSILKKYFTIGKSYPFTISACPGDQNEKNEFIKYYIVTDILGFEHHFYSQRGLYKIGQTVELTVSKIEKVWLEFSDPTQQDIQNNFIISNKYEFKIESLETDPNTQKPYFIVSDTQKGYLHRYYFIGEHTEQPGETIQLEVKKYTNRGELVLIEPGFHLSPKDLSDMEKTENYTYGRENAHLEYKSSFVYTTSGDNNIDAQLGIVIMRVLSSFMNAEGGTVLLGYRDDGSICGINRDIPFLNSSNGSDEKTYKKTLDGLELKIRNTITKMLGGYANSLVTVEFRKTDTGLLVCHLKTKPSAKPIYFNKIELYKRSGNMCQSLRGDEITFFIVDHLSQIMQNANNVLEQSAPEELPESAVETKIVEIHKDGSLAAFLPKPPNPADFKLWQYITLYKDGTVSRQKKESSENDVLFNIPLTTVCKKKSSRLLLCYVNGCVNVLNPQEIVGEKLSSENRRYSNGFNLNSELRVPLLCNENDYIVIRSRLEDGKEMIKAVAVENYTVHSPKAMQTNGNVLLDSKKAVLESIEVIPAEQNSFIYPILIKSKNGAPGYQAEKYPSVLAFLKHRKLNAEETPD